ncbi:hypothetical protein [Streptosporangium minutum]|uniref:hypothetical protein n=1 Tax=Streptosporangium minutum TaxID=569862 RepID=UPI0010569CFA|nr:hypothetical protein [Streptosporangium minutum]
MNMAERPPVSEHRKIGRKMAALAGTMGSEIAKSFRQSGIPAYDKGFISALGQPFGRWDSEADAVLWYLLRLFITGDLLLGHIPLDAGPGRDKERRRNQELLDELLSPHDILLCVDQEQQGAGYDGHVHLHKGWKVERIWFHIEKQDKLRFQYDLEAVGPLAEDEILPLEIGYTDPTRTFTHLSEYGAVVRWPYDSDGLYLLVLREGREADLQAVFEKDWKSMPKGTHVPTIHTALMLWLYKVQVNHYTQVHDVEIDDINVATMAAALAVLRVPIAMFIHVTGEDIESPDIRILTEDRWMKITGRGITVYAKNVSQEEDCVEPWTLITQDSSMPYGRLRTRIEIEVGSNGAMIAVPPQRVTELLRIANGSYSVEDMPMLLGAMDALETNGIGIGTYANSGKSQRSSNKSGPGANEDSVGQ